MQYILAALNAGKSVLCEKPIAVAVEIARDMLKAYHAIERRPVWFVGENYRFEPVFSRAAQLVPHLRPSKIDLLANMGMRKGNPYVFLVKLALDVF
jgi:predicted dehydrogenase